MPEPTKLTPLTPDEVRSRAIQFLTARKVAIAGGTDLITGTVSWAKGGCLIPLVIILVAWGISGALTILSLGFAGFITGPIALIVTIFAIAKGMSKKSGTDTVSVQIARVDGGTLVTASGGGRSGPSIARDFLRSLPGVGGMPNQNEVLLQSASTPAPSAADHSAFEVARPMVGSSLPSPIAIVVGDADAFLVATSTIATSTETSRASASTTKDGASADVTTPRPASERARSFATTATSDLAVRFHAYASKIYLAGTKAATTLRPAASAVTNRIRSLDGRLQVAAVLVVLVGVGGFVGLSFLNSPENQIKTVVETIAQRQYPTKLNNAADFAHELGITAAPASISFTVKDWSVSGGASKGSYEASWTLVATGGSPGRVTAKAFSTTFTSLSDTFTASPFANGPIDVTSLVAILPTDEEVHQLLVATNLANAPFSTSAGLVTESAHDPSGAAVPDVEVADPTLLVGERQPLATEPGAPPTLQQRYLVVDDVRYLVRSVAVPGTAATVEVGTLEPSTLTDPAAASLKAFAVAAGAGDLSEAAKYLVNADGLTVSGLKATTVHTVNANSLSVTGSNGDYGVSGPDGMRFQIGADGTWRLDYTGQPLAKVLFKQHFYYVDPSGGGSAVTINLEPIAVISGSTDPTFSLVFDLVRGEGTRGYNDAVTLMSLTLNGQAMGDLAGTQLCDLSPASGDESKTCQVDGVPLPPEGLRSIKAQIGFGGTWGPYDMYGSQTFSDTVGP